MQDPAILASYARVLVESLRCFGPAGARAERVLPEDARAALRADPDGWFPMAEIIRLTAAVLHEWGPHGVRRWSVAGCLAGVQQPPFRPFLEAAIDAGFEPAAMLHHACAAARVHFRGCGELTVESVAEDGATLLHAPIPPSLQVEPYLLLTAGMIQAFPVACGLDAEVQFTHVDDRAEFHLGWWVPGALQ